MINWKTTKLVNVKWSTISFQRNNNDKYATETVQFSTTHLSFLWKSFLINHLTRFLLFFPQLPTSMWEIARIDWESLCRVGNHGRECNYWSECGFLIHLFHLLRPESKLMMVMELAFPPPPATTTTTPSPQYDQPLDLSHNSTRLHISLNSLGSTRPPIQSLYLLVDILEKEDAPWPVVEQKLISR